MPKCTSFRYSVTDEHRENFHQHKVDGAVRITADLLAGLSDQLPEQGNPVLRRVLWAADGENLGRSALTVTLNLLGSLP